MTKPTQTTTKWKKIRSAPKDGSSILLAYSGCEKEQYAVGWWDKKRRVWLWAFEGDDVYNEPTHWMELPDEP